MKVLQSIVGSGERPIPADYADRPKWNGLHVEMRDDAKSRCAASDRPVEVAVAFVGRIDRRSIRKHDAGSENSVARETVLALQVAEAAPKRDPAEADGIARPARNGPAAVAAEFTVHVLQLGSAPDAKCRSPESRNPVQQRQIKDDPVTARCPDETVPSRSNREPNAIGSRKLDRPRDV